jgi:hypothetical protein
MYVLPRGGMKESGIGRENGVEAYEACKFPIFLPHRKVIARMLTAWHIRIYFQIPKANPPLSTRRAQKRPGWWETGLLRILWEKGGMGDGLG